MKKILLFVALFSLNNVYSQHNKCNTMTNWEKAKQQDPQTETRNAELEERIQQWISSSSTNRSAAAVITIPVVVHVIYNANEENISEAQINSQIAILNTDFRKMNADLLASTHAFYPVVADAEIEFVLAKRDPNGASTTGITRTFTDSVGFAAIDNEKFTATGGKDNWDPTKYLNLWVANLDMTDGTLGYAAFPSDLATEPGKDGVVIDFRAFGNVGTAGTGGFGVNNAGRTAVHEVGHWLNLRHIWGDATCGDDFVADTPPHEKDNYDCPTFPHNVGSQCNPGANGEMFMNYMDYVDDGCMNMFTAGQVTRMKAALSTARVGITNSNGGEEVSISSVEFDNLKLDIYPNPANGIVNIKVNSSNVESLEVKVYSITGQLIQSENVKNANNLSIDMSNEKVGVYFATVTIDGYSIVKKIMIYE